LPAGINKATGLNAALANLKLSPHNVIGVGGAENDFAFLKECGCSAAVANAQDALKQLVDIVLSENYGRGVAELIERIIAEDAGIIPAGRHGIRSGGCAARRHTRMVGRCARPSLSDTLPRVLMNGLLRKPLRLAAPQR
jgi:hypothetical protein